jgi:RNA polymerase sigma factor (sigma-70 family)
MNTDNQLLAEYAEHGSERAFRELVERRINLVHSAALREAGGNVSLAEDITQAVFAELASHARKLVAHPALSGWLYTCVRRMTANLRRAEARRQRREQEAVTMNELLAPDPANHLWQEVRPVLDDVMHELDEEDRTAVVMRFFEGRSFKEVGTALGLTENAANMRVERSLEKLHGLLSRRGINSTKATLAAALMAAAVGSAPSALAASVAAGALATAAAQGLTPGAVLARLLALAKTKIAVAGGLALLAAALVMTYRSIHSKAPATPASLEPAMAAAAAAGANDPAAPEAAARPEPTNRPAPPQMALQLLEAESGAPLPGAKLHLFYLLADGRGKAVKAVAGADGRLGVDFPQAPYRALNLFVTADGHVPKVTSWGFRRPMPSEYTMQLERGLTIAGLVRNEAGEPVAGAEVHFSGPGNDMSLADNIQFGPDTTARTDAHGRWSCNLIPRDFEQLSLVVTHQDYAEANLKVRPSGPDADRLVVTLPAGLLVAGVVQDSSGRPIEGAVVRQVRLNGEHERSRTTEASGAFEFKNAAAGELLLAVQAEGFAPAVRTLQVAGNEPALRFELGPGQLLHGRVVDEAGVPLTNAFVETTRRAVDKIKWSTNTDAQGRFAWDSAPPEPLRYSVLAEGFNQAYALALQADGSEHEIKLTRAEPDKATIKITGTVVDAANSLPLDAFKVCVCELDPDCTFPPGFYVTGKDGAFTLSLASKSHHPGYQVQIEKEGYLPVVSASLLRKAGNQTLRFELHRGAGPSGQVLLPSGEPALGATVLLCTSYAGATLESPAHVQKGINTSIYCAQTDADGRFSLAPAIEPQGLVIVHDQGYAEVSLAQLAAAAPVRLQPWGRLRGKVVLESRPGANQEIVAGAQETRYSSAGRRINFLDWRFEATTDAEGRFSFDKVPPGPCVVLRQQKVSNMIFGSHEAGVFIPAGQAVDVVLGGQGRPVTGTAVLPGAAAIDWPTVTVRLESKTGVEPGPRPKREDFSSVQDYTAAEQRFFQAIKTGHFGACCNADGSFRVPDVPAGTYELRIQVRDFKANSVAPHDISDRNPLVASLVREIAVPEGPSSEALDLGTLELAPQQNTGSGK